VIHDGNSRADGTGEVTLNPPLATPRFVEDQLIINRNATRNHKSIQGEVGLSDNKR
jgi:hypothetical protein